MLLVVTGNVRKKEVMPEVERLFGKLKNTRDRLPLRPQAIATVQGDGPQVNVISGPWKKAYLSLAFPIPGFLTEEATALEVLAHLLGGDESSRFYRVFKYERQLVDEISVSPVMLERGGMLSVHAQLDPDKVELFWGQLIAELSSLRADSFSAREYQRVRVNLEDSLFQTMETIGGLASKLGSFQFFFGSLKAEDRYLYELRHITPDQVQGAIDDHLAPSRIRAAVLLPAEVKLPAQALEASIASTGRSRRRSSRRFGPSSAKPEGAHRGSRQWSKAGNHSGRDPALHGAHPDLERRRQPPPRRTARGLLRLPGGP
jgi:zinc protease